jgi:hypothetical protein
MRVTSSALFGIMLAATVSCAHAQAPQKLVGEITRYDSGMLQIKSASSAPANARVTDRTRISVRAPSDISHVQPRSFIGVTAAPRDDGALVASEIHIFPESMRGTGEGHRPMSGGNTMTNATVASVAGARASRNSMTNATVANVAAVDGEAKLSLTYKGGSQTIVVPPGIPIMTTDTGDPSLLVPGAHVIVYGATQADGSIAADRISIGKDG